MVKAVGGVLVQCDPLIKALIMDIDRNAASVVVEDLDDTHVVLHAAQVGYVKSELNRLLSKNVYNPMEDDDMGS